MTTAAKYQPVVCRLCEKPTAHFAFSKSGFDIWQCRKCGFLFVFPVPEDNPGSIYSEGYFCGASSGFGYMNYDEDKIAMRHFFERALDWIENLVPRLVKMLDIGAATGFFMKLAEERGWRVTGVEISEYAAKEAKKSGLDVRLGTIESVSFPDSYFDAVTLLDVLEHVTDPGRMIEECRRILKPGGVIFINTPDTGSVWARIFWSRWHAFCPPEHMSYFNRKNLWLLLEKHSFHVERSGRISKRFTPAYTASMLHRWQRLELWDRLSKSLEGSFINRLSLPLNIRDNFFMIARKI